MSLLLGERFILGREIGAGGMARVFLGKDEMLDRPVAVKILKAGHDDTDVGARFRREGRTAARLSHPNIVQVYDAGEGELEGREVSYIVMEYVSGGDLKAMIDREGPLPNAKLARLGAGASAGLAHAHEGGVIHRDVKPHNILLDARGHPKLGDFGIARALDATQATQTGSYLGTALYSSPEQLRGEKATPKSDVYSLGITLYQAAVGAAPFTGTPIEVAHQHVSRTPTVPSVLGANLSEKFEKLILDCVEKDPDRRPTAKEVHERLRKETPPTRNTRTAAPPSPEPAQSVPTPPPEEPPAGPTPGGSPEEPPGRGPRREGRRRRGPILLAAAALLLVLLGVAVASAMNVGNESSETAEAPQKEESKQENSSEDTENQGAESAVSSEETAAGGGQETTAAEDSPEEAAAQAVEDYYTAAADGNYDQAWDYLSAGYRQQLGSQAAYTSQFDTLESIDFVEGPVGQVTGNNTTTVTGSTLATHSYGSERYSGTWTLVNEDGGWKISGQQVNRTG